MREIVERLTKFCQLFNTRTKRRANERLVIFLPSSSSSFRAVLRARALVELLSSLLGALRARLWAPLVPPRAPPVCPLATGTFATLWEDGLPPPRPRVPSSPGVGGSDPSSSFRACLRARDLCVDLDWRSVLSGRWRLGQSVFLFLHFFFVATNCGPCPLSSLVARGRVTVARPLPTVCHALCA